MKRTFSRTQLSFLLLTAAVLTVFGYPSKALADRAIGPDQQTKLGMLLPLSGNYSAIGADTKQGMEMAFDDDVQAASTAFPVLADSKGEPSAALTEFRKLLDADKVAAVYAFRGPVGMTLNPVSKSSHVALLGGVGNKEFATGNDYAFQVWPPSDVEGKFLADAMAKMKVKNVALFSLQDDWTSSVSTGFREALKKNGGALVFDKEILPSDNDFRTLLQQVKSKKPDALFLNVGLAQIGPLLKQLRELHIDTPKYSNFWVAKKETFAAVGAEGVEGVMYDEMSTDLPTLNKKLQERYSATASGATVSAYLGTKLMLQVTKTAGSPLTAEAMYSGLLKQTSIDTPDASFAIKNRCVEIPLVMKVLKAGKGVLLPMEESKSPS